MSTPMPSSLADRDSPSGGGLLQRSRKSQPARELVCEYVFRPIAHLLVLALAPLRVAPVAVVLAGMCTGVAAAALLVEGHLLAAALLVQLKTVLDNADGQLARATGRVSVLGRYLDSESDLLVDAALFAALGYRADAPVLAAVSFALVTLVVSANFNLKVLYRREHSPGAGTEPPARGVAAVLARIYPIVYGWQDRLAATLVERRLRGLEGDTRRAYHDRATLRVVANFGLSTQLAIFGACVALDRPELLLAWAVACATAVVALWIRRDLGAASASRSVTDREVVSWTAGR